MANILVCDDERSICEMLDIALRRDGHRVETVNSGQVAKNKIDGNLYDLIITDIKMPNIDGIEVLRHAHRVSPDRLHAGEFRREPHPGVARRAPARSAARRAHRGPLLRPG